LKKDRPPSVTIVIQDDVTEEWETYEIKDVRVFKLMIHDSLMVYEKEVTFMPKHGPKGNPHGTKKPGTKK